MSKRTDPNKLAELKIRVPEKLRKEIARDALECGLSMSAIVSDRLEEWYRRHEWLDDLFGSSQLRKIALQMGMTFQMVAERSSNSEDLTDWENDAATWGEATAAVVEALIVHGPVRSADDQVQKARFKAMLDSLKRRGVAVERARGKA